MRSRCASSSFCSPSSSASRSASSALDPGDRFLETLFVGRVVRRREQREAVELLDDLARERIDRARCARPRRRRAGCARPLLVGREDLDRVAAHAELVAGEREVVALVLQLHEPAQDRALIALLADLQHQELLAVHLRRTEAVDRRHRRDDDHVAAREQRARGRVPQPVDLVVDRAVLLDVRVGRRQVRLGLVVVVVGDEVLDPVLREELAELGRQLRGQRLVRRQHQRGPLRLRDHVGDREALARPGDAEQRLEPVAPLEPSTSAAIASGWSPAGSRSVTSSEFCTRGSVPTGATVRSSPSGFDFQPVRWASVAAPRRAGQISSICVSRCARSPSCRRPTWPLCGGPRRWPARLDAALGIATETPRPPAGRGASRVAPPRRSPRRTRSPASTPRGAARRARRPRRRVGHLAEELLADRGMRDRLELLAGLVVHEGHRRERGPVERAVGAQDLGPESVHELRQRRLSRVRPLPARSRRRRPRPRRARRACAPRSTSPSRSRP